MGSLLLYSATVAISVGIMLLYRVQWGKLRKILLLVAAMILPVLIYAFGDNVGIDRPVYQDYFNYFNIKTNSYMESGFNLLIILCKFIGADFKFLCAFVCVLIFGCIFYAMKLLDYEKYYAIGLFISFFLIYFVSFNAMRQMVACAFFLVGIAKSLQGKQGTSLLWLILACTFHKTAVIGLAFFVFFNVYNERRKVVSLLRANNYLYFLYVMLLSLAASIALLCGIETIHALGLFNKYQVQYTNSGWLFFLYFLPKMVVFLMYIKKYDIKTNRLTALWLMFIPMQVLGVIVPYADRLALYPSVLEILVVPGILENILQPKNRTAIKIFIVVYYIFYFLFLFYLTNGNGIFPYKLYQ